MEQPGRCYDNKVYYYNVPAMATTAAVAATSDRCDQSSYPPLPLSSADRRMLAEELQRMEAKLERTKSDTSGKRKRISLKRFFR